MKPSLLLIPLWYTRGSIGIVTDLSNIRNPWLMEHAVVVVAAVAVDCHCRSGFDRIIIIIIIIIISVVVIIIIAVVVRQTRRGRPCSRRHLGGTYRHQIQLFFRH